MENRKGSIYLRLIGFHKDEKYYIICLDTNIIVRGDTIDEAIQKIKDALISYLATFSPGEMRSGKFLRKAPASYFIKWYAFNAIFHLINAFRSTFKAEYNLESKNLSLA